MPAPGRSALLSAVAVLLRPLVKILLRHGVPFGALAEVARRVYVEVADEGFAIPGRKQTVSRISILTGLTRKEVVRLRTSGTDTPEDTASKYNRAARVVSGWVHDFSRRDGAVEDLSAEGKGASFATVVKRYSGDMPARAVLDELVRVGTVERLANGKLRLTARAYVPRGDDNEKLGILGRDVADLIATVDHNLTSNEPFFQRKVEYDNLPAECLPQLRKLSHAQGQRLLERLDRGIAKHDRDANPRAKGTGRRRVMVGVYYFEQDVDSETR